MNKRQFNQFVLALGALGLADAPAGLTRVFAQTPKRGGTLNAIINPEPPMLNVGVNLQTPTQTVAGKLFLGLLTYDFNMNPLPSLAKSWTVSKDGKTYTFELERNVKWHDGKPLTADDVVYTVLEFLPQTHPRAKWIFSHCESVTASDPYTVVFKLKEPFGAFMSALDIANLPVQPKHVYAGSDIKKNPANVQPIGCGPFKLKEWVRGSHIHLVRNDDYFRPGKPYLDAIIYRVIPDGASRAVALESGQVQLTQWTDLELFDAQRLSKDQRFALTTKGYEAYAPVLYLEMNVRSAPLNDKRFRQAVSHAIDRQFVKDKVLYGFGRVATSPIDSRTKFHDASLKPYDFSIDKATKLLDEMGLKPDAKGVRANLRLAVPPYGEMPARTSEYIKQALAKIGVAITLETSDAAGWAQKIATWNYDMNLTWPFQYGDPAIGVARNFVTSNIQKVLFTNTIGFSNPEIDKVVEAAASENDPQKRQALYDKMQSLLLDESPCAWLAELEFPTLYDKRLKNVVTSASGVQASFDGVYFEG